MSADNAFESFLLGPGWYSEDSSGTVFDREVLSLKIREVLYHQKSKYQDILVLDR